jgi:hypothetical protein
MSTRRLPAGHSFSAGIVWFRFHLARTLRTRAFWLLGIGVLGYLALLVGFARAPARGAAQVLIGQIGPLATLFFCTGVIRQEIEDQTLTYGFSRPVGRGILYMARVLAASVPVAIVICPAAAWLGFDLGPRTAFRYAGAAALAIAAYGGLFALIGQLIRWPTWIGLAFLLFWEAGVSVVPGFLGKMTLISHVRALADLELHILNHRLRHLFEPLTPTTAGITLLTVIGLTLWLGGVIVKRKEFRITR